MTLSNKEIRIIIEDEITVDCYGDEEINLGWAVYMEDNIFYPFEAEYKVRFKNGKNQWSKVRVVSNESSQANYNGGDYYVEIE